MKPPENAELFDTPLLTAWFDQNGILCSVSKNEERTIENYLPVVTLYKRLAEERNKICILADATKATALSKEVRDYLAAELPKYTRAMAVVADSAFGKMIANLFLKLKRPVFPMKMFTSEQEAKKWLKQYL